MSQAATQSLIQDLRQIIEQARGQVAATANYAQTMMYWHVGERINREVLGNQRAEYGKQIVSAVSTQLQAEYGKKGFEPRSIWRMMQFAQEFPDVEIVSAVSTKITWSHIIEILPLKDDLQREFYLTLASTERWSMRQLRKEIDGMLFDTPCLSPCDRYLFHTNEIDCFRAALSDYQRECQLGAQQNPHNEVVRYY